MVNPAREAFEAELQAIDKRLASEGVDIPFRPLRAIMEFAKRGQLPVRLDSLDLPAGAPYTLQFLNAHVDAWYKRRYGDRLIISDFLSPGRMAILIRGDLWIVRFPVLAGTFRFVACATSHKLAPDEYDMFRCFQGMTPAYRDGLGLEDWKVALSAFWLGFQALSALSMVPPDAMTSAARVDHDAAVQCLATSPPHPGLSRWASLQATEKLLKAYLANVHANVPATHSLLSLTERAEQCGLSALPRELIGLVQCTAGVRYGEVQVERDEAVTAHHAALHLTHLICPQLQVRRT
jgi:hypothetical protein